MTLFSWLFVLLVSNVSLISTGNLVSVSCAMLPFTLLLLLLLLLCAKTDRKTNKKLSDTAKQISQQNNIPALQTLARSTAVRTTLWLCNTPPPKKKNFNASVIKHTMKTWWRQGYAAPHIQNIDIQWKSKCPGHFIRRERRAPSHPLDTTLNGPHKWSESCGGGGDMFLPVPRINSIFYGHPHAVKSL